MWQVFFLNTILTFAKYMVNRSDCLWMMLVFLLTRLPAGAQDQPGESDLSDTNISYLYDLQSPIAGETKIAMGQDEATVFFKLDVRSQNLEVGEINYVVKESYANEEILHSGSIGSSDLIREDRQHNIYRFTVPMQDNSNYLFIFVNSRVRSAENVYRFDTSLNSELNFSLTDLVLMESEADVPIFTNFLPRNVPFRLVSLYQDVSQAFIYYYSHEFEPNPPPMASAGSQVQKSLEIDSIFPVNLNEPLSFDKEGLYFTQTDTTSLSGISFRIEEQYYPRFVTANELIRPIRYISTSEEMDNLLSDEQPKLALDRYWVKATRSRERAKDVIRSYYRQVTKANVLFTTYKEGWKTSQGMVYLLYGAPNIVYRSDGEERWIYSQESNLLPDMSFTFVKVRNIFSTRHYNLLPDEEYGKFWYRNIDLWRKGRKQL